MSFDSIPVKKKKNQITVDDYNSINYLGYKILFCEFKFLNAQRHVNIKL